ncbi:MAG TPA: hypothetical protein VNK81_07455 [Thermodesulfobacteriota bacterium]|nr:hypothetical protein [Thermodesulfobacteriota bacterium]
MIALCLLTTVVKANETGSKNPMIQHPEWYIRITDWYIYATWSAVAIIHHVTIENTGDVAYRNIRIRVYYTSTSPSQEGITISQETGILPITLPPHSKETYLKGGTPLGVASQFMNPSRIEILGATPIVD